MNEICHILMMLAMFAEKGFSSCLNVFRDFIALQILMDAFWLMIWGKFLIYFDLIHEVFCTVFLKGVNFFLVLKVSVFWSYFGSLGKTLQSITLLYTLLGQGFDGKPMVKKIIIATPTSLVSNWEAEIKKWVGERVKLIALCESTREDVISGIDSFTNPSSPFQVKFALNVQNIVVTFAEFKLYPTGSDCFI